MTAKQDMIQGLTKLREMVDVENWADSARFLDIDVPILHVAIAEELQWYDPTNEWFSIVRTGLEELVDDKKRALSDIVLASWINTIDTESYPI